MLFRKRRFRETEPAVFEQDSVRETSATCLGGAPPQQIQRGEMSSGHGEEAPLALVLAYFDGDHAVFRPAAPEAAEDEAILEDEGLFSYSAGLPRDIAYEIEDDEPVYRSLGSLTLGGAPVPESAAPAPPSICRQRGFGQPGLVDC